MGMEKKATEAELNKFETNYASREDVANRFMEQVQDIIPATRNNRLNLEEQWLDDLRLWSCRLDGQGYQGKSNLFVAELHNQVESSVEKALGSLFPGSDVINCVPKNGTKQERTDKIQEAVRYELEKKNSLFLLMEEHERQKVLFGTSIVKGGFKKDMLSLYTRGPAKEGEKLGKPIKSEIPKFYGAKWDVIDLFRWYIYPEVSNLDNAKMIFEDQIMDLGDAKRSGLYVRLDQVQAVPDTLKHQWADIDRMEMAELSSALKGVKNSALFTEVWCDFEFEKGKPVPAVGVIANNNVVVRLKRNPFWFQSHPYAGSAYLRRPGKIYYGLSLPDKIRTQCYQMTDMANQVQDSLNYSLSPIVIIDPALAGDLNGMKVMPGARWLGSPEGINFQVFPDVSGAGLRAMQEVRAQIAQFSDNSPGIAPQLQGKARSATQATLVQNSVSQRSKVQGMSEEMNILIPMCEKTHILLQQFMDKDWEIKSEGPVAGSWIKEVLTPDDLVGEVDWEWAGSSEAEKTAVRTQQILAFYNLMLQTNSVLPPGELDLVALSMRVAKEGFNITDLEEIFKSERMKKTVDPELENIALKDGEDLDINYGDNDDEHMKSHETLLNDKKSSDETNLMTLRHIEKHKLQKQAKDQIEQAKAKMAAIQQASQAQDGGQGPQDGREGPQVASPMEGNRGQQASSPDAIMSSVKGVETQ